MEGCTGCVDEMETKTYFPCSQCLRNPGGFHDYYELPEPDDDEDEDEEFDIS